MSYLVLARKWRPTSFDEVVGQGHVTRTLKNAISAGRVAHAMLFTGSRGVGKTSCARILAKALNCDQGPTTNPCGVCPSCIEITEGRSVDVFEIDGASNNSVEQIREIREAVKFVSSRGKRKLYIIDEVHMLSTAAFNALLKTLEEPPPHVLFVFATTEAHKIPDTILSRCQRYDFKRISERAIVDALTGITEAEGIEIEPAALHHIAREAQGGMRDSLSLLDQVIAFSGTRISEKATREVLGIADRRVLTDLTRAVLAGDGPTALRVIDDLFRFGLDLQKFAGEFVQFLRDLMVIKVCAEPARLVDVPPEEVALAAELVRDVAPARIHRLFNALMKGAEEVARSPFPKLVLEMTLLRLCEQGPTLPLAEVLAGLARLEGRLDQPVPPDTSGPPRSSPPRSPDRPPFGGGGGVGPSPGAGPGPRAEAVATTPARPAAAPEATLQPVAKVQPSPAVVGNTALAVAVPGVELSPYASRFTRKSAGLLKDLPWPSETVKSPFDPPVPAVRQAARGRAHLRILPPLPDEPSAVVPEPSRTEPSQSLSSQSLPSQSLPSRSLPSQSLPSQSEPRPAREARPEAPRAVEEAPLDLADGRPLIEHYKALVDGVEGFTRSQLRNNTYVRRFDRERLEVALPAVFAADADELSAALADAAVRLLGRVPEVRLEPHPPGAPALTGETVYEWEQRRDREARRAREDLARRDPAVQAALSILSAEIIDIKIDPTD